MTCSVKDCKNVKRLQFSDDVSYHRIPKDRLDIFMEIIRGSGTKSSVKNKYICSEHFVASDFIIKNDKKYLTKNALPQLKLPVIPKREDKNEEKQMVDVDVGSTSREVPVKQVQSPSSFIIKNDKYLIKNAVPQPKLPVIPKREVKNGEIDADVQSTSREVPVKQIQSPSSLSLTQFFLPKSEVHTQSRRRTVSSSSTLTTSPVRIEKSPLHSAAAFEVNVKKNLLIESPGSTSANSSSSDTKRKIGEFVNVIHSYSENPGKMKRKLLDSKKKLVKMSKKLYTAKQTIKKLKLKVSSLNDIIENLKKERMLPDD